MLSPWIEQLPGLCLLKELTYVSPQWLSWAWLCGGVATTLQQDNRHHNEFQIADRAMWPSCRSPQQRQPQCPIKCTLSNFQWTAMAAKPTEPRRSSLLLGSSDSSGTTVVNIVFFHFSKQVQWCLWLFSFPPRWSQETWNQLFEVKIKSDVFRPSGFLCFYTVVIFAHLYWMPTKPCWTSQWYQYDTDMRSLNSFWVKPRPIFAQLWELYSTFQHSESCQCWWMAFVHGFSGLACQVIALFVHQ